VVLAYVLLRDSPELVVVLALDDAAADARDLLHVSIVMPAIERRKVDETSAKAPTAIFACMATFALIAEHPPNLCPTSNAQTRRMLKDGADQIPHLAEQLGIEIGSLRIFGPEHIILAVVEADDIDSVRTFALQSGLMQWNTVKVNATYSIEEAVAMIDEVEAIF
jgi:hypothetical protein